MPRRIFAIASVASMLFVGWPQVANAATIQTAASDPYAITTLPAYYGFTKTVKITNTGKVPAIDVQTKIVLLAPSTPYAHVTLTGYSKEPNSTHRDHFGNLIADYDWSSLAPGQTKTIVLHYQATSSEVSYRLPKTYGAYNVTSQTYQQYTNPNLDAKEIDADSKPIEALDASLVKGISNPYLRAQALFDWVAKNIHYNYSLKASGSALKTLQTRLGICSDFADLYVSMLRTDHIPAQLIGGYVTNNGDGQGGFHQWVEFYLPKIGWIVADPTWGRYGYFAALQDDWHIPLYDGIRPDVSVHWQYDAGQGSEPYLAINYHYSFVTEQSPAQTSHVKLPLVSITPPVQKRPPSVAVAESDWHRIVSFFHQYFLRLRLAIEAL